MNIGFFDSGVGGLTILRAVRESLPQYNYIFYGDTLHLPYGDRSEEEVCELTKEGMEYLFERDCSIAIIACNTASAETLRTLQDGYLVDTYPDRRILGVIVPTVEEVLESGARKVTLIGTQRTIDSGKYERELANRSSTPPQLVSVATPWLVPLIEAGHYEEAIISLEPLMEEILASGGDSMILGCTHYTLLKETLRERYGHSIGLFSQDEIIPAKLYSYLNAHPEFEIQLSKNGSCDIYLTDNSTRYAYYRDEWGSR